MFITYVHPPPPASTNPSHADPCASDQVKTDAILELAESVAIEKKTPKTCSTHKNIPSNNPEAFCNIVRPILEGQKI